MGWGRDDGDLDWGGGSYGESNSRAGCYFGPGGASDDGYGPYYDEPDDCMCRVCVGGGGGGSYEPPVFKKFPITGLLHTTKKAMLFSTEYGDEWFPKSQIREIHDDYVVIPDWLYSQKRYAQKPMFDDIS